MKTTENTSFDASKYALVDLHLHLDGSLDVDDASVLAKMAGIDLPEDRSGIAGLLTCPEDCESLVDYLKCFALPCSLMQRKDTLARAVAMLVRRLDSQGLLYAEICFAPQKHTLGGLSQEEVVRAAIDGLEEGISHCRVFKAQLILCCMRGEGTDEGNEETVHLAGRYLGKGVCGLDIAGAEALYPLEMYGGLFALARQLGVPFTIHAGEAAGAENVRLAVEYGARRIGHGVRACNDAAVKQLLRDNDVCLTLCLTSNRQTNALEGLTVNPLKVFLEECVPVCINTDNMTVSGTTLRGEFRKYHEAGLIDESKARSLVLSAVSHAFLGEDEKRRLLDAALRRMA